MAKRKTKKTIKTKILSVRITKELHDDAVARKVKFPKVIEAAIEKAISEADAWMPAKESK